VIKTKNTTWRFSKKTLSILCILFHVSASHSADFEIKVPIYLDGVNTEGLDQEFVSYKLKGQSSPKKLKANYRSQIKTVEDFMSNLFYVYKNDRKKDFLKLFMPDIRKTIRQIPKSEFNDTWKVMSNAKNHYIDHYFQKNGGYFVSWNAEGIPTPRGVFLKKGKKGLQIANFITAKSDRAFQNIETYFQHRPLPIVRAEATKTFSLKDPNYELAFKTTKERPWIFLFKKEDKTWMPKVAIKDNFVGKLKFDDADPKEGRVLIKFKNIHFTKGVTHEILAINSNFPMGPFPVSIRPDANLIIR
jgi:hypothetical protein